MTQQRKSAGHMPAALAFALWAAGGFALTAATLLWFERGAAILLELASVSAAFICF